MKNSTEKEFVLVEPPAVYLRPCTLLSMEGVPHAGADSTNPNRYLIVTVPEELDDAAFAGTATIRMPDGHIRHQVAYLSPDECAVYAMKFYLDDEGLVGIAWHYDGDVPGMVNDPAGRFYPASPWEDEQALFSLEVIDTVSPNVA